jgi:hypothetical protein
LESCLRRKDSEAQCRLSPKWASHKKPSIAMHWFLGKQRGFIKAALDDAQMGGADRARSEVGR